MQKLLAVRGDAVAFHLRSIARVLVDKGPLPYRDIGRLLLAPDGSDAAEKLRLKIARDYWRALDLSASDATPES